MEQSKIIDTSETYHCPLPRDVGQVRGPPWSIPPPAEHRRRLQDGISRIQKVTAVEIGFRWLPRCFRGTWVYIGGRSTSVAARGAHKTGGRAQRGWARPPITLPPWLLLGLHSKSSGSRSFRKSRSRRFHSVWTPFDIPFLRNTEISKKNSNTGWASG